MEKLLKDAKIIGFDADDTLWVNEPYFRDVEAEYCKLFAGFHSPDTVSAALYATEMQNIELYGYGVKAFTLSLLETAYALNSSLDAAVAKQIILLGKSLLAKPVILLDGVQEVLEHLAAKYTLVIATKGDLFDQQRKLAKSGLAPYFHYVEVMSEKKEDDYRALLRRLNVKPADFLMVGNSLKSDILPVTAIGGRAVYVPYHTTWQHELVEDTGSSNLYKTLSSLLEFPLGYKQQ